MCCTMCLSATPKIRALFVILNKFWLGPFCIEHCKTNEILTPTTMKDSSMYKIYTEDYGYLKGQLVHTKIVLSVANGSSAGTGGPRIAAGVEGCVDNGSALLKTLDDETSSPSRRNRCDKRLIWNRAQLC
uniref:Uncharacterized protein n=1 Tax=Romanomermis culicivorax TaxID=13658 RepID=A0A915LA30_ROMCU